MSKIYISGPISGIEIDKCKSIFASAMFYCMLDLGYCSERFVINPFNIKPFLGLENWLCYMINDVRELLKCDSIYMLKGWQNSRGACIEHLIAVWRKMEIIYQV